MAIKQMKSVMKGIMLAMVTVAGSVNADDTELYTNNTGAAGGTPLVMFTLDFRPSLTSNNSCKGTECDFLVPTYLASTPTSRLGLLKAVLKYVMEDIGNMKIGLMITNANDNKCAGPSKSECSGGAYILQGFEEIKVGPDTVKDAFYANLDALNINGGNTAHTWQGKELFFEFFRYITGQDAFSSHLTWTNYGTDDTQNLIEDSSDLMRDLEIEGITLVGNPDNDADIKAKNISLYNTPGTYISPIDENCQKIFTVNFAFGVTQSEDDADTYIIKDKVDGGMENISLNGKNDNVESVLEYMYGTDFSDGTWGTAGNYTGDQNVTSFFVVDPAGESTGDGWAVAGGTTSSYPWSDDPQQLIDDLKSILSQILSVSTTFTAASVPVSVLNRAQVVDNVYIALFRADADGKRRWPGNVKKLKLDLDEGVLVDADGSHAIGGDGRILQDALTFWTNDTHLPDADADNGEIDGKDGRAVARGGHGQQIPGYIGSAANEQGDPELSNSTSGARQVYYLDGSTMTALNADIKTSTSTADDLWAKLDATDPSTDSYADVEELLKYVRGYDVYDEDGDKDYSEAREWILGDPLHSRPLPINYGARGSYTDTNPDIRLVYGSNDGFFHMVKNTDTAGSDSGVEMWAFMPEEVMAMVPTLRDNTVGDHPYGVDGAPAMYYYDHQNSGKIGDSGDDQVIVYFGLRRGGEEYAALNSLSSGGAYYALDITNPDAAPVFKWRITPSTAGFGELGYTFSTPRVGYMNINSTKTAVVLFTAGYDTANDSKGVMADDSYGRAIYVVNATTGALIWKAEYNSSATGNTTSSNTSTGYKYVHQEMVDSMPSTLTVVDTTGDGLFDRAYVGDTGGKVWRIDMSGGDASKWSATVLANLGRHNITSTASEDRRFFHRPDFVQYRDIDTGVSYDAVIIGSGNRANPLGTTVDDYIYMIKDYAIYSGSPKSYSIQHYNSDTTKPQLADVTDDCLQTNTCKVTPTLTYGWKIHLEGNGEKALATATTLAKTIYITSFEPPDGASTNCKPNEGVGYLYAIGLDYGYAVNDYYVGNGEALEQEDRKLTLKSGGIPAEVVYVPFNRILKPDLTIEDVGISGRWETYWYKEEE